MVTIDNTDIEKRENKAYRFKAGVGFSNVGISNAFKTLYVKTVVSYKFQITY